MKKLTLILLLAFAKISFAQNINAREDTTLVYSSPMYTKDLMRYRWRPVVKPFGELYQVTFYDNKDVIQEIITFADRDLTVRTGPYIRYEKGKLKEKGSYDKGHKSGVWTTYLPMEEQIKKIEHFIYGKKSGKQTEFWNGNKEEGEFINGKKAGQWLLTYVNGKPAGEEIYDENGKKIQSKYFDKDGKQVKYEDLFSPPSYKAGINAFYKYLGTEIKYPAQSAKQGIQGTVFISFSVKKNGELEDINVDWSPNKELAIEAVRVLNMSPDWMPGKMFGEVANVRFNIPIKFYLKR